MGLVEPGKLSLDNTLQKSFPNFPTQGNHVTVRLPGTGFRQHRRLIFSSNRFVQSRSSTRLSSRRAGSMSEPT